MGNAYQIEITGTSGSGNTAFFSPDTVYTPIANFFQTGTLLVETPIFPSNDNSDPNEIEIALTAGNVIDSNVSPGEIQFTSNTALHVYNDGNFSQLAALDITEQEVDPLTGAITIQIGDIDTARASQLNLFNTSSSITSAPKQILTGEIELQFSPDFTQVSGTISLGGSSLIEPGTYLYQAEFEGVFTEQYVGLAEGSSIV